MKKLLFCGIAMAVCLGDAFAGNAPGKRLKSISNNKTKFESSREVMLKYAKLEDEAHRKNGKATKFEAPLKRGGSTNSTQSVSFIDLGDLINPFSVVAQGRNYVSVAPSLNAVALIRRGGSLDPGLSNNSPGNKLMYDYSLDGGNSWTLRPGRLYNDLNYTSWLGYDATNNFGARYPQGVIWNPAGNTDPANAMVFGAAAVLDGTNGTWGAVGRGWKSLTSVTTSDSPEAVWRSEDVLHYIGDAMEVNGNGDIFYSSPEVDASGSAIAFTDKICVFKFAYNSATGRFDSTLTLLPFPNEPGDYATYVGNTAISFAPTGNVGYLAASAYNISYDSLVTLTLYVSKTIDGGTSWSDFKVIRLNYKNDYEFSEDIDAIREQMLGNYVRFTEDGLFSAQRGEEYAHRVDYFLKDMDLTVDQFGYAHVLAQYCVTSFGDTITNDPGNFVFYPGYGSWMVDVTVDDMSAPAKGEVIGTTDNIRGCFGDCSSTETSFTEDSRPQVARSADGSTISFVWFATDEEAHPQATDDFNSNPDMWVRTIKTPSAGVFLANDEQRNMTKGTDYDGQIICGSIAPVMLNRPAGGFEVASTAVSLAPNPTSTSPWPTQFFYMKGVTTSDTIETPLSPKILKSSSVLPGSVSKLAMSMVPNPNKGKFIAQISVKESGNAHIMVVNHIGQILADYSQMLPQGDVKVPFDFSAMQSGIYFVKISINGQSASQRIVKN